jgi:hypothetical protein
MQFGKFLPIAINKVIAVDASIDPFKFKFKIYVFAVLYIKLSQKKKTAKSEVYI